jgi:hypothetical protein
LSDDVEAIHVGQAKVEDDKIGRVPADHVESGVRVGGCGDDIALLSRHAKSEGLPARHRRREHEPDQRVTS